ncbi:MAG: hypothetical protein SV775_04295 [Thermodesulfobacteriota bacterium]|nr:hypothetical protein [Thermodesulfobacteriota bacterium]
MSVDRNNDPERTKNILGVNDGPPVEIHVNPSQGMKEIRIGFTRSHDRRGLMLSDFVNDHNGDINKESNYNFSVLDEWVRISLEVGANPIICFEYALDDPEKRVVADPHRWSQVARNVVLHSNGYFANNSEDDIGTFCPNDVKYYQIWNEPEVEGFSSWTTDEYDSI